MKITNNQIDGDDLLDEAEDSEDILSANDPAVREKIVSTTDLEDLDDLEDSGDAGDESISGEMPDLESDSDLSANRRAVGLGLDEDEDNPKELNIAADVAAAEAERHGTSDATEDE